MVPDTYSLERNSFGGFSPKAVQFINFFLNLRTLNTKGVLVTWSFLRPLLRPLCSLNLFIYGPTLQSFPRLSVTKEETKSPLSFWYNRPKAARKTCHCENILEEKSDIWFLNCEMFRIHDSFTYDVVNELPIVLIGEDIV